MKNIIAGVYQHYKGGYYQCFGICIHSETGEKLVVYVSLSGAHLPGPRFRVRPVKQWFEIVKWPDGVGRERFLYWGQEIL